MSDLVGEILRGFAELVFSRDFVMIPTTCRKRILSNVSKCSTLLIWQTELDQLESGNMEKFAEPLQHSGYEVVTVWFTRVSSGFWSFAVVLTSSDGNGVSLSKSLVRVLFELEELTVGFISDSCHPIYRVDCSSHCWLSMATLLGKMKLACLTNQKV